MRKKPELLAPAGNMEKLKVAVAFGADAVYLAGRFFGMRSMADNFETSEIEEAVSYCHQRGVKVYVTVNVMPRTDEYEKLTVYLKELEKAGVDALIVSDLGVFMTAKETVPKIPLHISTQASTVSTRTCREWQKLGAERIVLARELSLNEIKRINSELDGKGETEIFIHGSMCVAYSGRCLLSNYLTGRDANHGACAQPCRWEYRVAEIEEVKRPGERLVIEESGGETMTFSSRDLCMIEHIPELIESGAASFKIEGRMKSSCYAGIVTGVYRKAIDTWFNDPVSYKFDKTLASQLESVCHREYCTGFFFGGYTDKFNICRTPGYIKEQSALGLCIGYDKEKQMARFMQKNKFCAGDTVELVTPDMRTERFTVSEIYTENGEKTESVPHPKMIFDIKVPSEAKPYSILRAASEREF